MRGILLAGTSVVLILATDASAQVAATSNTTSEQAANEGQTSSALEEIIVTAQRRQENLQRAAVPVDVVRGSELVDAGVTQIERLNELTPALSVQNGGSGAILFLRGVGNFTVTPNADPALAFSYDGVYIGRPSSTTGMFYDLDRIEVLKGPQGTLYGRNATGGAINVIPTQPKLNDLGGYGEASYGNYDTKTLEGAVNLPIGEEVAVRASGSIAKHDGYLRDGTLDQDTHSARLQLKAVPISTLTVRLSGDFSHSGGVGFGSSYLGNYVYNPATKNYNLVPSELPISEGFFTPAAQAYQSTVLAAGRHLSDLAPYPFQDNSFYGLNGDIAYDTGVGTLTVIPAWRKASLNYLTGVVDYRNTEKDEQYSIETRFAGEQIGMFEYIIGGYYFDETIHENQDLSLSSTLALSNLNYHTKSEAGFGRLTAHITDQFRLVGGLRYTNDDKGFQGQSTSGVLICPSPLGCPNGILFPLVSTTSQLPFNFPPASGAIVPQLAGGYPTGELVARSDGLYGGHLTNDRVTYRGAAEYDVAPSSLLYASYETGYHSGGFSPAAGFETYQPEYIDAVTVGSKNRFLEDKLQLNLESFYWKYTNQQISHVGLDLNGKAANYTQNIGRSRIWGGEMEGRALLARNTLVSADVQYLDAQYTSFSFQQAVPTARSPPPLSGCAVSSTASPMLYNVDCIDKPAYNSPRWTVNLAAQQTIPIGAHKLVLGADTQFKSARVVGFEYLPQEYIRSNFQTNARVSFLPDGERWSIAIFVHNIENKRVITGTAIQPVTDILTVQMTEPRLFGGRVSVEF